MQLISHAKRTIIVVVGAAALGLLGLQWLRETTQNNDQAMQDQQISAPDYFMNNFTIITTHGNGTPYQKISGDKLTHFTQDTTQIENPIITLNAENQSIWQTTADHGVATMSNQLTLDGNVNIEQINDAFNTINISTEALTFDLTSRTAESMLPVEAVSPHGTINANGMSVDIEKQHIQLYSGVKAAYVSH